MRARAADAWVLLRWALPKVLLGVVGHALYALGRLVDMAQPSVTRSRDVPALGKMAMAQQQPQMAAQVPQFRQAVMQQAPPAQQGVGLPGDGTDRRLYQVGTTGSFPGVQAAMQGLMPGSTRPQFEAALNAQAMLRAHLQQARQQAAQQAQGQAAAEQNSHELLQLGSTLGALMRQRARLT